MTYDVIIAGAGLSGLAAAQVLSSARKKVLLIEARNRIGGRLFQQQVYGGAWIDRGGQWIEGKQKNTMRYVESLNLKLINEYEGEELWTISYGGGPGRIVGDFPAPNPESEGAAIQLDGKLGALAESESVTKDPWLAKDATGLDGKTLAQWISENSKGNEEKDRFARYYVDWNARFQQSGGSSWEVPLLHALFEISVNKGPGEGIYLVVGGAGLIVDKLLTEVENRGVEFIRGSKVVAIAQEEGVTVTTTQYTSMGIGGRYQGKFAIVAMPPILSGAIHYDPPLPPRRLQLIQRMPMGTIAKVACIYQTAWWRTGGRSGHSLGDENRTAQFVVDSGDPIKNEPGILSCFIQGNKYITWSRQKEDQRRQTVTDDIHAYFGGDEKTTPCVEYVEAEWPAYPLTGGAYNGYASVGAWTGYGPSLRDPHDRVYWAGTEMATQWYGGMDGAISAGETAAEQILKRLG